jgi:hypothetical protein
MSSKCNETYTLAGGDTITPQVDNAHSLATQLQTTNAASMN